MANPNVPAEMPATVYVWHHPRSPLSDPPDASYPCQYLFFADWRVISGEYQSETPNCYVDLLVPYGSDLRDVSMSSAGAADLVTFGPDGATFYTVLRVEVAYRGFARQCYRCLVFRTRARADSPLQ